MKVSKAILDEVLLDDVGKPFDDKATYADLLRKVIRTQMYIGPDGRPCSFDENPEDKFRVGMVAFKISKAQKHIVLSSEDVSALKRRAVKVLDTTMYVRMVDLLEEKGSAEKRAEKENDDAGEEPAEKKAA